MISMKLTIVLFANLLCLPTMAQRDFRLTEQRNAWLTSSNAAALTTFGDSTIAHAALSYRHDGGRLHTISEGTRQDTYSADVRSYSRLSADIVAYGSATYSRSNITDAAGSMLLPTISLMPFDLVDDTNDNAGDKSMETFCINGAIGWKAWRRLAIGARLDYTAGTYAKQRDLRHSNTLMDMNASLDAMLSLPHNSGIGVGMVYSRRTESMQFKTYGTTDQIYYTLIDYANHHGERETFGTEGFTDSKNRLPLLSEYIGVTAQAKYDRIFADIAYRHRNGYYGRKSQYSASHEQHHGDCLALHLRYDIAQRAERLVWFDLHLTTESLTSQRENYRRTTATNGTSAIYYEYFEPTKMADKVQTYGTAALNAYWKPSGQIYLWHITGGTHYQSRRQTAYVYPDTYTASCHIVTPFVSARRSLLTRGGSLLSAEAGCSTAMGSYRHVAANAAITYEMPVKGTHLRPAISLKYDFRQATNGDMKGLTRNTLTLTASATF